MMRILIIPFIILLSSIGGFSQIHEVDSILFSKINDYRDSLGLNRLIWHDYIYQMAKHHTKYLSLLNAPKINNRIVTHYEEENIINFQECFDVDDRAKKYMGKKFLLCSENVAVYGARKTLTKENLENETLANIAFNGWLNSKEGHKEIMEGKTATYGACSVQLFDGAFEYVSGYKNQKVKTTIKKAVAVFNIDYIPKTTIVK